MPNIQPTSGQARIATDEFEQVMQWENITNSDEMIDFAEEDSLEDSLEDEEHGESWDAAEEDYDLQGDEAMDVPSQTRLATEEVVEIINRRIEEYNNAWKPPKTADPHTLWDEAEASGERKSLEQKHAMDHAYYGQRLNRLCDEIVKFPGSNANQVRRQCSNVETTIDSMELAGWLRDIYQLGPLVDSDDGHDGHGNNGARNMPPLQAQPVTATKIIDLDIPSESSDVGERNASPFNNLTRSGSNNVGDPMRHNRRSLTPDSVIADSIEPTFDGRNVLPVQNVASSSSALPLRIPTNHGDEPEKASISSVRHWRWADLVENLDRKRIVSKTIPEMRTRDHELVRSRIRLVGKVGLLKEIAACAMLRIGETKLPGTLPRHMPKIVTFTNLFLSWWFCRTYSNGPELPRRISKS